MESYNNILSKYWGHANFRPKQLDIIESVADGKDTLGLLPTGGGKSVTFQIYSLSRAGICIVVTPLIALMKDQVENLLSKNIRALKIHSGMSRLEIKLTLDNAVWGDYKFLYVSPERLKSEYFLERLEKMNVNLIAVDEAHCISQWGYDFRPSYLNIASIRKLIPSVPVLALTATATRRVIKDIQDKLGFKNYNVISTSFVRSNLSYLVRTYEDKQGYLAETVSKVKGSGIVYMRSRKGTREIAAFLTKLGVKADFYHAGLKNMVRSNKQDDWLTGKTRIIVATNAFGMGIDKPDVRFVIHMDPPDSLESYFQEAGRAGRDGRKAAAVLLFNNADKLKLKKMIALAFPEPDVIKRIYQAVCNHLQVAEGYGKGHTFNFSIQDFSRIFKFKQSVVYSSLKILQNEGYFEFADAVDNPSRIYFSVSRDDLYKFQVANAEVDVFIKLLLRSYTGLFNGYVNIDEDMLAKRAGITHEMVWSFLKHLRKAKIIDYIPKNQTPYIYFNKERVSLNRLKISKENYDFRKRDYMTRIDSVIHYSTSSSTCRSQLLLSYFGESDSRECGICDVCRNKLNSGFTAGEFDRIKEHIKELLTTPQTYETLLLNLSSEREKSMEVLKWLMDNKDIITTINEKLVWK